MVMRCWCFLLIIAILTCSTTAWTSIGGNSRPSHELRGTERDGDTLTSSSQSNRRLLLGNMLGGAIVLLPNSPANAVVRAVGSAEQNCREAGDCLEKGEWDGAVGWSWGGKDRCDATDPRCGPNGQLLDAPPSGEPVPEIVSKITHEVELRLTIGKNEPGTLRFGLYGQDCPATVAQMVAFLSSTGIATTSRLMFEDGYGVSSAPVSLTNGGILNAIVPQQRLEFGVPSQAAAYARSKGKAKAGSDFVTQPRPKDPALSQEPFVRKHDAAGLVSVPGNGLGYGGTGLESEDEAFASAFQITAGSVPNMDKERRRVIGQVLDDASMAVVARLATLPTKKGIKGVIPGQNSGPPLLKVAVQDVTVEALPGADAQPSS